MKNIRTGRKLWSFLAIIVSVAAITAGLLLGQQSQVLAKAVRVCLECIGIG